MNGFEIPTRVTLANYGKFKEDFNEFVVAMVSVKLHPQELPYTTRMRLLNHMEAAYRNIYKFGDDLMAEMPKVISNKTNERYFLKALDNDNSIKISEGKAQDFFITAPPLGDRYIGNSGYITFFTSRALEAAKKNGAVFKPMSDACVIVKQYCRCADVAMGTVENREIHSLTDAVLKSMRIDDNPWFADFCYVWCESAKPRTEIVITSRESAPLYNDFVSEIYEQEPSANQRYHANNNKKTRVIRNIKRIGDIISAVDSFSLKYAMLDKPTCRHLCHLTKALMEITTDLREPFVSSIKHEFSHLYTHDSVEKKKSKPEPPKPYDFTDEIFLRVNKYVTVDNATKTMTIKTKTPFTTISRRGKSLCDDQETLLAFAMPRSYSSPLSHFSTDDLSVTLIRELKRYNPVEPDSDNLNLNFLRPLNQRAKIIYIKTNKNGKENDHDCEIIIRPKSSEFWL